MRTSDFIAQAHARINNGEHLPHRSCASVFVDGDALYSYGYHYPLLFTITTPSGARVWVRNTAGYSNTTARHISHCEGLADIDADLPHGTRYGSSIVERTSNLDTVRDALVHKLDELEKKMASKKRTDTKVYKALYDEREKTRDALALLTQ